MKLSGPLGSPVRRPAKCRKAVLVVLFSIASATLLSAQTLVSIAVTPANPSFALGTTEQMTATGTYSDGSTLDITSSVTWTSQHPSIATINAQGLATSVAVGTSRVTASLSGINGSTRLTITAAALVSIAVTPALPSIALGMTKQFTATGTFTDQSTQNITTTVQWSSSAATVATISNAAGSNGLATSAGVGSTTITATSAAISGNTTLAVTAATLVSIAVTPANPSIALGTTQQFTATGTFTDSHTQNLTSTATWDSSTLTTAVVSPTGLATSLLPGTATISATSGGITGSTVLTVTAAVLVSIAISPLDATIPLGATQQFTATGTYSDGTTQDVTATGHWTSTSATVATISNSAGKQGLATSKSAGTTTIGITLNAVSSSVTLTVSPVALVTIAITPPAPTISLGTTQQFTATGTYSDGSTQAITAVVTWSSSAATVATISNTAGSNGLATSAGVGSAIITATSGTVSATATLTVGSAALESLAISPLNPTILVGGTAQFTATGTFTDGSTQDETASVTWSSDTPAVASISAGGLATGIGPGIAHITAASGNIKSSTTLTVTVPVAPVCTLQVSPASGQAPLSVTVTATCSAQTGAGIATTILTLGDGFYQSGSTATHTFVSAGTFTVSVVATDTTGKSSQAASSTVSVTDPPSFFVGVSNGQIEQFDTSGNLLKTLNTGRGGSVTGMAFDALDALYVTDFTADGVSKFDGSGNLIGNFGTSYNCQPESIVFDQAGNAYVGETGCSHALLKFDAYGNLLAGSAVTTEVEGSDWIDLASDQCTIFYTSQGTTVFRFNACTDQQLPVFATGLHTGLGLRILPDASVLVADQQDIMHLDSAGRTIGTYTATGENCWVSLTLDPDGTSFWAVDYCTSDIVRFDITSGNQLAKFNSGTPTQTVYGIAMRGAPAVTTAAGPLIAAQQTPSVTAGQSASFALAFAPVSAALNQTFSFSCANLPVGAACSFSPQTAMATSSGVPAIQVTLSTTAAKASLRPSPFGHPLLYAWCLLLPGVVLLRDVRRKAKGKKLRRMTVVVLVVAALSLFACGGGSPATTSTATNPTPLPPSPSSLATPAGTYSIVLQASSSSLVSSTVVSLTVH
jgi:hypothetical protein